MNSTMSRNATHTLTGALILGLVQGLTEFLPVSSSGHLVVGAELLGITEHALLFDTLLHLGTLMPVLWYYRSDLVQMVLALGKLGQGPSRLWREDRGFRLAACVVIGTLPTGIIGLTLEDLFERLFSSLSTVGFTFLITGAILMSTRLRRQEEDAERTCGEAPNSHLSLTAVRALLVGLAQGLAITPGISRSGSTIAAGLLLGVQRAMAARLSFLLSVPAILGAVLLQLRKLEGGTDGMLPIYLAGTLAAAVSGYLALRWLVALVRRGGLHWFALYVWPLGASVLVYSFFIR